MENNNKGCLSILLPIIKFFGNNNGNEKLNDNGMLPYAKRDDFLSPSELSFYKILNQVITDNMTLCTKVRLGDIFFVKKKGKSYIAYLNKINRKHVDFLICKASNLEPICGIELDDTSHQREKSIETDIFKDKVFLSAGLPLIRFINKNTYNIAEVKEKLEEAISKSKLKNSNSENSKELTSNVPICPKCLIPMVKRTATKGEHAGEIFYGCSNFPKCMARVKIK